MAASHPIYPPPPPPQRGVPVGPTKTPPEKPGLESLGDNGKGKWGGDNPTWWAHVGRHRAPRGGLGRMDAGRWPHKEGAPAGGAVGGARARHRGERAVSGRKRGRKPRAAWPLQHGSGAAGAPGEAGPRSQPDSSLTPNPRGNRGTERPPGEVGRWRGPVVPPRSPAPCMGAHRGGACPPQGVGGCPGVVLVPRAF